MAGSLEELYALSAAPRMNVPDRQLIAEAIAINHADAGKKTLAKYAKHLDHWAAYMEGHGLTFYTLQRRHVRLFMAHLAEHGGPSPHELRLQCPWCAHRGWPDGAHGPGWSPSTRKGYLSAARFMYTHFANERDLPDFDPTTHVKSPRLVITRQFTPSPEQVRAILNAPGEPKDRLVAVWSYYAPSRRQTFSDARWRDIDLERCTWDLVGKGDRQDRFDLHPVLVRELRRYLAWQLDLAKRNPLMRDALSNPDTAWVIMTRSGRKTQGQSITKMLKWRAVRAGVAVVPATSKWDSVGGKTSLVSAHAMRRAWASAALNDPHNPQPIDVVSQVLRHADIATTRRHYAPTKGERARSALMTMRV